MKKRKLLATLLTGTMLCGVLAGCGNSNTPAPDAADPGASAGDGATDGYNMTLIMSLRDEFLSELEGAAKAAADEQGITLTTQDANNDVSKQIQYIEAARNAGEDAVIVNMVDPATAAQCIEAAGDMKLVFVNRFPVDETVLSENAVYVGSDEMTSGAFQGEFLAKYFQDKGQTEVKYILLNGTLGQTSTENRTLSFKETMAASGITLVEAAAPLACDFDRAIAMDMISPLLKTTEFDCIVSNNDAMALGAIEAMLSQDLDPASVPIVGIDATTDGREAIKNGTLAMSVFQNPVGQGAGALIAAMNMLNGTDINAGTDYEIDDANANIVWVPFEPVTPDNVADYE